MTSPGAQITALPLPPSDCDVGQLAALLTDAVDSGAAVSFMAPLSLDAAAAWWRETLASSARSNALILVAREHAQIVGSVQVQPAWAPNQPHRAEICKLIVHRTCRGRGVGAALMTAAEHWARDRGLTLLTLDARRDGPACPLYRKLGWVEAGTIPRYALNADGRGYHDTVYFYKDLARPTPQTAQ